MPWSWSVSSSRSGWSIAIGLVAFLGSAHILIRTSMYRIDYHSDPYVYMTDARALANGKIFESNIIEGVLVWYPPFYASVLSVYRLLGIEVSDMGRYVNTVCFGLIILVAGHWLHRFARFHLVMIGTAVTIGISYPLVRISSQLFSEPLFILMTLLAMINMESFLNDGKMRSRFWLSIVFSALAFLTRYIGVTVIFIGALLILTHRGHPPRFKWKLAALYSVVSSLPTALWMIRNWFVIESLTARELGFSSSGQSLWDTLTQFGDQSRLWITVSLYLGWLDICLWVAIALAGFEAVKALLPDGCKPLKRRSLSPKDRHSIRHKKVRPVLPFAAFTIVYLVVLFIIAPYTAGEPPANIRYLLPIYVPAVMAAAIWLERFLLKTYRNSGVSVWKNSDSWGLSYNKTSGPLATTRWIIMGLILTIILTNITRNIALYIGILTTYDPYGYQF